MDSSDKSNILQKKIDTLNNAIQIMKKVVGLCRKMKEEKEHKLEEKDMEKLLAEL